MIKMVKIYDGGYAPKDMCIMAESPTSEEKVYVDCVYSCVDVCGGICADCLIQKIFNEYVTLTNQEEV